MTCCVFQIFAEASDIDFSKPEWKPNNLLTMATFVPQGSYEVEVSAAEFAVNVTSLGRSPTCAQILGSLFTVQPKDPELLREMTQSRTRAESMQDYHCQEDGQEAMKCPESKTTGHVKWASEPLEFPTAKIGM